MTDTDTAAQNPATAVIAETVEIRPAPIPNPGPGDAYGRPSAFLESEAYATGITQALKADPKTEYVAASGLTYTSAFAESLPSYIDDVDREFGADIYERMYAGDGHVAGELNALLLSALSGDVILSPAAEPSPGAESTPAEQADYDTAAEVRAFCQYALDNLTTPLQSWLFDMARAAYLGHRVSEIVYRVGEWQAPDGTTRPALLLDRLKVKQRYAFAFVVDNRRNVVGLVANLAGRVTALLTPVLVDLAGRENLLPREKFAVFTFRPKEGDPRGTSLLRPAYNAWWLKQAVSREYFKFLANAAGPSLWGTTAENAQSGEDDMTPEQAMAHTMAGIKNGMAVAFPAGSTLATVFTSQGEMGGAFQAALTYYNHEMTKAILSQSLATNDGQHNARAAAQSAKDIMDLLSEEIEKGLSEMLRDDVFKPLVSLNYGDAYLKYLPLVSLSQTEEADIATVGAAYAGLATAGLIQDDQKPAVWAKLGLPVVEVEEQPEPTTPPPGAKGQTTGDDRADGDAAGKGDPGADFSLFSRALKKKRRYASITRR